MSRERRRWFRWRGRRLRLLALAPVLILPLANLCFALPWMRARVAGKVAAHIGLPVEMGGISWWPWRGIRIDGLNVAQPEALRASVRDPLVSTGIVEIDPLWSSILRGRKSVESVRIHDCRVTLAAEMLAHLAGPPTVPVAAPQVAVVEPAPSPETPQAPGLSERVEPSAAPQPAPLPAASPDTRPPLFVEMVDADFRLVHAGSGKDLLAANGVAASLPLRGAYAEGRLELSSLHLAGTRIGRDLRLPLRWHSPELRCERVPLEIAGMEIKLAARMARAAGLPFAIEAMAEPQRLNALELPVLGEISVDELKFTARAGGMLGLAASWQAVFVIESGPVTSPQPARQMAFLRSGALLVLHRGVLSCPDARLIGEELSLLANGAVTAAGGTGVLRLVIPPGSAQAWTKSLAGISPDLKPVFTPLETPDRTALDLRWISYEGKPGIELGPGGPFLPQEEAMRLLGADFR